MEHNHNYIINNYIPSKAKYSMTDVQKIFPQIIQAESEVENYNEQLL